MTDLTFAPLHAIMILATLIVIDIVTSTVTLWTKIEFIVLMAVLILMIWSSYQPIKPETEKT